MKYVVTREELLELAKKKQIQNEYMREVTSEEFAFVGCGYEAGLVQFIKDFLERQFRIEGQLGFGLKPEKVKELKDHGQLHETVKSSLEGLFREKAKDVLMAYTQHPASLIGNTLARCGNLEDMSRLIIVPTNDTIVNLYKKNDDIYQEVYLDLIPFKLIDPTPEQKALNQEGKFFIPGPIKATFKLKTHKNGCGFEFVSAETDNPDIYKILKGEHVSAAYIESTYANAQACHFAEIFQEQASRQRETEMDLYAAQETLKHRLKDRDTTSVAQSKAELEASRYTQQIMALSAANAELVNKNQELENKKKELEIKNTGFKRSFTFLKEDKDKVDLELKKAHEESALTKSDLSKKTEEFNHSKTTVESQKAQIKKLEGGLQELKYKLVEAEQNIKDQNRKMEAKDKRLTDHLNEAANEQSKFHAHIDGLKKDLVAKEAEFAALKSEHATAFVALKAKHAAAVAALKSEHVVAVSALNSEHATAIKSLDAKLKAEIAAQTSRAETAVKENAQAQADVGILLTTLEDRVEAEAQAFSIQQADIDAGIQALKDYKQHLSTKVTVLTNRFVETGRRMSLNEEAFPEYDRTSRKALIKIYSCDLLIRALETPGTPLDKTINFARILASGNHVKKLEMSTSSVVQWIFKGLAAVVLPIVGLFALKTYQSSVGKNALQHVHTLFAPVKSVAEDYVKLRAARNNENAREGGRELLPRNRS